MGRMFIPLFYILISSGGKTTKEKPKWLHMINGNPGYKEQRMERETVQICRKKIRRNSMFSNVILQSIILKVLFLIRDDSL